MNREGSPAEKAGLKAGDIIVEADGAPVKGSMDLINAINAQKVGTVSLTVVRNGSRQTLTVTPEESKGEWDLVKMIATVPGKDAFRPLNEGDCPLVKTQ